MDNGRGRGRGGPTRRDKRGTANLQNHLYVVAVALGLLRTLEARAVVEQGLGDTRLLGVCGRRRHHVDFHRHPPPRTETPSEPRAINRSPRRRRRATRRPAYHAEQRLPSQWLPVIRGIWTFLYALASNPDRDGRAVIYICRGRDRDVAIARLASCGIALVRSHAQRATATVSDDVVLASRASHAKQPTASSSRAKISDIRASRISVSEQRTLRWSVGSSAHTLEMATVQIRTRLQPHSSNERGAKRARVAPANATTIESTAEVRIAETERREITRFARKRTIKRGCVRTALSRRNMAHTSNRCRLLTHGIDREVRATLTSFLPLFLGLS